MQGKHRKHLIIQKHFLHRPNQSCNAGLDSLWTAAPSFSTHYLTVVSLLFQLRDQLLSDTTQQYFVTYGPSYLPINS